MKLNKEGFKYLILLLLVSFAVGVLVGGYLCKTNYINNIENEKCTCSCKCACSEV